METNSPWTNIEHLDSRRNNHIQDDRRDFKSFLDWKLIRVACTARISWQCALFASASKPHEWQLRPRSLPLALGAEHARVALFEGNGLHQQKVSENLAWTQIASALVIKQSLSSEKQDAWAAEGFKDQLVQS